MIIPGPPTPTFNITPTFTPNPTDQKVKLNCIKNETYTRCWDETLNIQFDHPISWGEIETWMLPGFSGYRYDYFFGGETTLGEAEPLLAGGRSRNYKGRRGGMPTDFSGFSSTDERCNEVKEQYPICQVIKPDVVWMMRFPSAEDFCYRIAEDVVNQTKWQPIVRIEVNLPNNPIIQGFMFESPFLSIQLLEQLNADLLSLIGLGSATSTRDCSASNMQSFGTHVQAYIEQVKAKDLDKTALQNMDELLHLANSITFTTTIRPTDTVMPSPTPPPAGTFVIKFYPPLVLDYPTDQWIDKSEYNNTEIMINYLQNIELTTCTITPMGASGFYPENMNEIILGNIRYQILPDQKITAGNMASYYFAISSSKGSIKGGAGIPHFVVQSSPLEGEKCRIAAEKVLATLRRPDQSK